MPGANAQSSAPVARIDRAAIAHNYGQVRAMVGPDVEIISMVKADAYGHGADEVARELARSGCRFFGVATLDEAEDLLGPLRAVSADVRLLVVGGVLAPEARRAVDLGVEVGTQEAEVVAALGAAAASAGRETPVHVKVDSGMTRLGVQPEDVPAFVRAVETTRGVRAAAIFSHFAVAESVSGEVTRRQLATFREVSAALAAAGIEVPRHMANSAGVMTCKDAHMELVRPGLMLYGLYPDPALRGYADLRPVMSLVARVVRVADVPAGRGISYGHTFHTTRPSRIATLRCGYADGYPRALSNLGRVRVNGKEARVVGRVCMDHTMIDVSEIAGVKVGDAVTMWGAEPLADEIAADCGTISYELVTRVGKRVPRVPEG